MANSFEDLIQELSETLEVELIPDRHRAVALRIHDRVQIQLQEDQENQTLLVGSLVCELPPGKFRENVLAEALKTNGIPSRRIATLGYLARKNSLTLHQRLSYSTLEGKQLAVFLSSFIELAESWQKAIERGQAGPEPKNKPIHKGE